MATFLIILQKLVVPLVVFIATFATYVFTDGKKHSSWAHKRPWARKTLLVFTIISSLSVVYTIWTLPIWSPTQEVGIPKQQPGDPQVRPKAEKQPVRPQTQQVGVPNRQADNPQVQPKAKNTPNFDPGIFTRSSGSTIKLKDQAEIPFSEGQISAIIGDRDFDKPMIESFVETMTKAKCSDKVMLSYDIDRNFFWNLVSCLAKVSGYLPEISDFLLDRFHSIVRDRTTDPIVSEWDYPLYYMLIALSDNKIGSRDIRRIKSVLSVMNGQMLEKGQKFFNGTIDGKAENEFARAMYYFFFENPNLISLVSPSLRNKVYSATDAAIADGFLRIDRHTQTGNAGLFELYGELGIKYNMDYHEHPFHDIAYQLQKRNNIQFAK